MNGRPKIQTNLKSSSNKISVERRTKLYSNVGQLWHLRNREKAGRETTRDSFWKMTIAVVINLPKVKAVVIRVKLMNRMSKDRQKRLRL